MSRRLHLNLTDPGVWVAEVEGEEEGDGVVAVEEEDMADRVDGVATKDMGAMAVMDKAAMEVVTTATAAVMIITELDMVVMEATITAAILTMVINTISSSISSTKWQDNHHCHNCGFSASANVLGTTHGLILFTKSKEPLINIC